MTNNLPYSVIPRVLIFVFDGQKLLMIKYSGRGDSITQEKKDRKGIYNFIGGHIEDGEDVIDTAIKEAWEEAGIRLVNPKIKGIVNVNGFGGKNIINFIITGTTLDKPIKSSVEGDLEWIEIEKIPHLNIFADTMPLLEKLLTMKDTEMFVGTTKYEGFNLIDIRLKIV